MLHCLTKARSNFFFFLTKKKRKNCRKNPAVSPSQLHLLAVAVDRVGGTAFPRPLIIPKVSQVVAEVLCCPDDVVVFSWSSMTYTTRTGERSATSKGSEKRSISYLLPDNNTSNKRWMGCDCSSLAEGRSQAPSVSSRCAVKLFRHLPSHLSPFQLRDDRQLMNHPSTDYPNHPILVPIH